MKEEIRTNRLLRYRDALQSSVALFREGKDHAGLDALLNSVEDLESVLDIYQCTGEACVPIDTILAAYRRLLECMRHQDITGMTDLLEYTIYPLAMEQEERRGEACE